MRAVAFTGPVDLTQTQAIYVHRKAGEVRADRYLSGCAYGVDTQAILGAWETNPEAEFVLTPQCARCHAGRGEQMEFGAGEQMAHEQRRCWECGTSQDRGDACAEHQEARDAVYREREENSLESREASGTTRGSKCSAASRAGR